MKLLLVVESSKIVISTVTLIMTIFTVTPFHIIIRAINGITDPTFHGKLNNWPMFQRLS
jgi:hypothetical protein